MKPARNVWLDSLRGAAALGVALFHFNAHTHHTGNLFNELTGYGRIGVEVFFVLSGYCIQAAAYRAGSLPEFFWQRFWRLYPPYFFSLIVLSGVAVARKIIVGVNDAAGFPTTFTGWLATLTIMTTPATPVKTMNWAYWTLSYEVVFYVILGFLIATRRYKYLLLYLITGVSFFKTIWGWPGLFFLSHWAVFALGVAFCEYERGEKLHGTALLALCSLRIACYFSLIESTIVAITIVTVIISAGRPNSVLNRRNWFSRAGEISYSIYLLHVPVGVFAFVGLQSALGLEAFPANLLYYVAIGAVCLGGAYLSFKFVERPAMRVGKSFNRVKGWCFPRSCSTKGQSL